jgi:hypothetical protein
MTIKNIQVAFEVLQKLFSLPDGVVMVAARQVDSKTVDITIVDSNNGLPNEATFDANTRKWIANGKNVSPPIDASVN